jgi:hypothetical protein
MGFGMDRAYVSRPGRIDWVVFAEGYESSIPATTECQ